MERFHQQIEHMRDIAANGDTRASLILSQEGIKTLLDGFDAHDRALQEPALNVILPLLQKHRILEVRHHPSIYVHPRHGARLRAEGIFDPIAPVWDMAELSLDTAVIVRLSPVDLGKTEAYERPRANARATAGVILPPDFTLDPL